MNELRELYQEMILDHNKQPRNFYALPGATHVLEGYNPLCGDKLKLYLQVENGSVRDISFEGSGCAISKASASMMTDAIKGQSVEAALALFEQFHAMLSGKADAAPESLGKLKVFSGVNEFPARVKCATLAWHTLKSGLVGAHGSVTTEDEG